MNKTGTCACGKVEYNLVGEWNGVVSCHCKSCQRLHGNYNPMMVGDKEKISITGPIKWYNSSDIAERGFCEECGSQLFKRQKQGPKILISVGSLDDTDGLSNVKNVFTEDKGGYYIFPPEVV